MHKLDKSSESFRRRTSTAKHPISKKEQRVLDYLAETGHSNREIAEHFGLSEETIKRQILALFDKTGAGSRAELVIMVWRSKLSSLQKVA